MGAMSTKKNNYLLDYGIKWGYSKSIIKGVNYELNYRNKKCIWERIGVSDM